MTPQALHYAPSQLTAKTYMKGWSHIPLIMGRIRPSKRLTSTWRYLAYVGLPAQVIICTFEMLIPEAGVKLPL